MEPAKRKTPRDTTEFEREQLRFFLSQKDISQTLQEINPSLAWLPELTKTKIIQVSSQLAPWIERNFGEVDAVREVAANINIFDEATADQLEFRLHHQLNNLPPPLAKCWQLIIRHIRNTPRGLLQSEWFEIEPRIKAGEQSQDVLERLAGVLRPKPRIGRRFSWHDESHNEEPPQRPSDLMSIEYEVEDGVNEVAVLAAWPPDTSAELERRLLNTLTGALNAALEDAIDAEVEGNEGYGISDTDVPSVAAHKQNEYRSGFLPIVRVIAETWSRLANKDASLALPFVERWSSSPLKLNQRLALFAAADRTVPAEMAADVLIALPQGLLFLTNTSVEVIRLIHERWMELPAEKRSRIERRIVAGPPPEWFRSDVDTMVERSRYELLGEMQRAGLALGATSKSVLAAIEARHPHWELRPQEQAGFHIWHETAHEIVGDATKLQEVPAEVLVDEARKAADNAEFMEGDAWQALCESDPQRALRGLEAKAREGQWPAWAWKPFLWATKDLSDPNSVETTGNLLLNFPKEVFSEVTDATSWWLNEKAKVLSEHVLWPLWDKVEAATRSETTEEGLDG